MILNPKIITHPHIPKPLHGMNPRSILGDIWWNKTRKEAYDRYNNHCISCGVHKTEAKKYKWLEAHENYSINYETGQVNIISIEPLCHYCHNFIHSGRLQMIEGKEKTRIEVIEILNHGLDILRKNTLNGFYLTIDYAESLGLNVRDVGRCNTGTLNIKMADWDKWHLLLEGEKYFSKFKNYEEWKKYYNIK